MRYRSFFSYARADDRTANWLHRQLDGYRTPKTLVGVEGEFGPAPAKLHPIFRDRTDLESGGHVDRALQSALENSETLIVLCTPTSAKSRWVNHECETFLKLGREAAIFPVIAAGEPESGDPETECFPPALRGKGLLAADLREIRLPNGQLVGDGREGGRLKLIAGLLGVPLDRLVQRERNRQRQAVAGLAGASFAFAALAVAAVAFGWLAQTNAVVAGRNAQIASSRAREAAQERDSAIVARKEETVQRQRADTQTVFALTQRDGALLAQRGVLLDRARALLLSHDPERALAYVASAGQVPLAVDAALQEVADEALHSDKWIMGMTAPWAYTVLPDPEIIVRGEENALFFLDLWTGAAFKLVRTADRIRALSRIGKRDLLVSDELGHITRLNGPNYATPAWRFDADREVNDPYPDRRIQNIGFIVGAEVFVIGAESGALTQRKALPSCRGNRTANMEADCLYRVAGWAGPMLLLRSSHNVLAFDPTAGQYVWSLDLPDGAPELGIAPDGTRFAVSSGPGNATKLRTFEVRDSGIVQTANLDRLVGGADASALVYAPDGNELVIATSGGGALVDVANGTIKRLSSANCIELPTTDQPDCVIATLGFIERGNYFIRVLSGGRIDAFRAHSPLPSVSFQTGAFIGDAHFDPNKSWLATRDHRMAVTLVDIFHRPNLNLRGFSDRVLAWTDTQDLILVDGDQMRSTARPGSRRLSPRAVGPGSIRQVGSVRGDRGLAFVSSADRSRGAFKLVNFSLEEEPRTLWETPCDASCTLRASISVEGDWALLHAGHATRVLDLRTFRPVFQTDTSSNGGALSHSHTWIANNTENGVEIIHAASGRRVRTLDEGYVAKVQFSPHDDYLVALPVTLSSRVSSGTIYRVSDGALRCRLPSVGGNIANLDIDKSGRRIALAGGTGSVLIVSAENCAVLGAMPKRSTGFMSVHFAQDDRTLITSDQHGVTEFWSVDHLRLIGRVEQAWMAQPSPDGRQFAIVDPSGAVRIGEAPTNAIPTSSILEWSNNAGRIVSLEAVEPSARAGAEGLSDPFGVGRLQDYSSRTHTAALQSEVQFGFQCGEQWRRGNREPRCLEFARAAMRGWEGVIKTDIDAPEVVRREANVRLASYARMLGPSPAPPDRRLPSAH